MMEGTGMHRHSSVRQIAYKIRISSAQFERKSSRATRGHRAKVLPKCETIITTLRCRREACRCFSAVPRCYPAVIGPRFSGRKAMYVSVLAESTRENAGYQRRVCCSGPRHFGQRAADFRGVAAAVCCKSAAFAAKGGRPPGRAIGIGAVSLWLQIRCKCSQTAPATVQLRDGNTPNSAMHCVKGKPVAVKIGFAVGSAKLVVPLPP